MSENNKVTFYYNPMSRGRIAHWMLEEVGAEYEIKLLDWKKADHKSPEYLKINPMGKIPTIIHKGVTVTETAAICAYLADAFPKNQLAPAIDDPTRGTYYRWFFFTTNCVEPAFFDQAHPRAGQVESSHLSYGTFDDTMKTLEGVISKGFLMGAKFSAADVYLASLLGWTAASSPTKLPPAFMQYMGRCTDRPAYKRFTEKAGPIS